MNRFLSRLPVGLNRYSVPSCCDPDHVKVWQRQAWQSSEEAGKPQSAWEMQNGGRDLGSQQGYRRFKKQLTDFQFVSVGVLHRQAWCHWSAQKWSHGVFLLCLLPTSFWENHKFCNWSWVDSQCCVSFRCTQSDSVIHVLLFRFFFLIEF